MFSFQIESISRLSKRIYDDQFTLSANFDINKKHTSLAQTRAHHDYIYSFKYDYHHHELCKLESRQIFGKELSNKVLFSNTSIDPSISPFIKNRLEIICCSEDYTSLLKNIAEKEIRINGFKAEYLILTGDASLKIERNQKLKDIGYRIEGEPNYDAPTITYAICYDADIWYFGVLVKHNTDWLKHKQKPRSFSNSIDMSIAKTLVSIASKGNKAHRLLDACCGVGTVMLEGCCAGFTIAGCDIKENACQHTRENLAHYCYSAQVYHLDIKDHDIQYDAVMIDLPYNFYAYSTDTITASIIASSAKLTTRIVIVSISDIEGIINQTGLKVVDFCTVEKRGKSKFTRNIWVCEKK